jgi:hypothetical protein
MPRTSSSLPSRTRARRARDARPFRTAAALVALIGATGFGVTSACSDPVAVEGLRTAIEPKLLYRSLWVDVRVCSGLERDYHGIRWYVTPWFPDQPDVLGQWNSRREITLRTDAQLNADVISHELLHDLLDGDGLHADPAWVECDLPVGKGG